METNNQMELNNQPESKKSRSPFFQLVEIKRAEAFAIDCLVAGFAQGDKQREDMFVEEIYESRTMAHALIAKIEKRMTARKQF